MSSILHGLESFCAGLFSFLKADVLYSTILFPIIVCITLCLRKKSDHWHVALWILLLIRCLLPPDLSFSYSARSIVSYILPETEEIISKTVISTADQTPVNLVQNGERFSQPIGPNIEKGEIHNSRKPLISFPFLLALIWMIGVLALSSHYIRKVVYFRQLVKKGQPINDCWLIELIETWRDKFYVHRKVRLLSTSHFSSPFSMGLFRPVIVIPESVFEVSSLATLKSIIAHEMVHIKRFDDLTLKLQNLVQILYFFDPIIWYVNHRINVYREVICDSMVLSSRDITPKDYCRSFINIMRLNVAESCVFRPVTCFFQPKKKLEQRLKRMLQGGKTMKRHNPLFFLVIVALFGIFVLPMAVTQTSSQEQEDEEIIVKSDEGNVILDQDDFTIKMKGDSIIINKDGQKYVTTSKDDTNVMVTINNGNEQKTLKIFEKDGDLYIEGLGDEAQKIEKAIEELKLHGHGVDSDILKHFKILKKDGKIIIPDYEQVIMSSDDFTPLMKAAFKGDVEKAEQLIKDGADVNEADKHHSTPLTLAAEFGKTEVVRLLLENKAEINAQDNDGDSPLLLSLMKDHRDITSMLLDKGADVNIKNKKGTTPLWWAAYNGNLDVCQTLIKEGLDVNISDDHNSTPLTLAAQFGHLELVEYLVKKGANINAADNDGDTPLLLAIFKKHTEIADFLLKKGADVNARNNHGSTPLTLAAQFGLTDMVKTLVKKGVDINISDNDGDSPLLLALMENHIDIIDFLLDEGADISVVNDNGYTCLMKAAENGNVELVKYFLKKGQKVNKQNDNGSTALILAAANGHTDVVELLVKAGEDLNATQDFKRTALIFAAMKGHNDVAKKLVTLGADVNVKDKHHSTALTIAAEKGNTEMVKLLVNNGADVNAKDKDGDSSLKMAKERDYTEIVEILENEGATE